MTRQQLANKGAGSSPKIGAGQPDALSCLPASFASRGVRTPFTTKSLRYSRVLIGQSGRTLVSLPGLSGGLGTYEMPLETLREVFDLSVHDRMLFDRLITLEKFTPEMVREHARAVAVTGVGGVALARAGITGNKDEKAARELGQLTLLYQALRQLGVSVINLPGGEIFQALQSGAIDGTEWVGPWNDLAFGFYKVAKYYYYPGFHEPGPTLGVGLNKGIWDKLSDSDKAIVTSCARDENNNMYAEFMAKNGQALATLINEHGVQLKKFSDEIFDAFGTAAEEGVAKVAEHDDMAKRNYESYITTRKDLAGWTDISEQAYSMGRNRIIGKE